MSNVPALLPQGQLPAHLRRDPQQARASAGDLAGGVTAGFPIISYRGKVWRVRKGGDEVAYTTPDGDPIPSIEVVLIRSNKLPSKTYYKGKWVEGDSSPPDCWSSDGIKPDAAVREKQSLICASCPRNAWGSRVNEETGKKGRECSDVRRMAVAFANELERKGTDCHKFLMRVPPASLNPLKDYAEKVLAPAGVDYFAVVTKVGFDTTASHPKLTFKATRYLNEEEYNAVLALRDDEDVHRILSESNEFAEAGTTGGDEAAATVAPQKATPAPAPARTRPRPVAEEEVATATAELAPAAPVAEDEGEYEDEPEQEAAPPPPPPPPPAPRPRKPRAPSAPAPAPVAAAPVAPAAAPAGKADFDSILDSLLGK